MTDIKIGPTFGEELIAAGLGGLPMSWSDLGDLNFTDDVTEEQRKKVKDVLKKHDPKKVLLGPMEKLEARIAALEMAVKELKK
jgi:hypothetical protein